MKSTIRIILPLFIIAIILAAITNPKKADFVDYYETEYVENSETMVEEIINRVAKEFVGGLADQASHDNYVVFSVFELGDTKYIGAFGNFYQLKSKTEKQ